MINVNGLRVFYFTVLVQRVRHKTHKKILLAAVLLVGVVSSVEGSPLEIIKVPLEFKASGFNLWEPSQDCALRIFIPYLSRWVDTRQRVEHGGAKGGTSIGLSGFIPVAPSKVSNKAGEKYSPRDRVEISGDEIGHVWFLVWILIALSPLMFKT